MRVLKRSGSAAGVARVGGPALLWRRNVARSWTPRSLSSPFDSAKEGAGHCHAVRLRLHDANRVPATDGVRAPLTNRAPLAMVLWLVPHRAEGGREFQVWRRDLHH